MRTEPTNKLEKPIPGQGEAKLFIIKATRIAAIIIAFASAFFFFFKILYF
jgi:hypothetical protein